MSQPIALVEEELRVRPDDDAAWLVYADWLSERGDARGELIRLELAPTRDEPAIAALRAAHEAEWKKAAPRGLQVTGWLHGFPRALAVKWTEPGAKALRNALASKACRLVDALAIWRPREVSSEDDEDEDEDFDPDGEGGPPPVDIAGLEALDLGGVRKLDLGHLAFGEAGAKVVAALPALPRLVELDLRYCALDDKALRALLSPGLPALQALHLQRNLLGADAVKALAEAALPALRRLDLRYNALGAEGARALVEAPFAPQLERLALYGADVGEEGAALLAEARALRSKVRAPFVGRREQARHHASRD